MKIVWDQVKLRANLRKHGLDFTDAAEVFAGISYTIRDDRFEYGVDRFITLGMLGDVVVLIAHTETTSGLRVISMRKATRNEQIIYFENI